MRQADFGPMLGKMGRSILQLEQQYNNGYRAAGKEAENIASSLEVVVGKLNRIIDTLRAGRK